MASNNAHKISSADTLMLRKATISIVHEATLQDLLQCSNNAVERLLLERNALLCKWYLDF
jgi:hypothetical protein